MLLKAENQTLFLNAHLQPNDINNLSITGYKTEYAEISGDGKTAVCTSRIFCFSFSPSRRLRRRFKGLSRGVLECRAVSLEF
jgi:hypothetical protein